MAEPIRDMRDAMAALHRDTEKIQGLRNQIARLTSPMPCGHPGACMVQVEEGTAHCSACEREGALREWLEAAVEDFERKSRYHDTMRREFLDVVTRQDYLPNPELTDVIVLRVHEIVSSLRSLHDDIQWCEANGYAITFRCAKCVTPEPVWYVRKDCLDHYCRPSSKGSSLREAVQDAQEKTNDA